MPDRKKRFVTLPPQAVIEPLDPEPADADRQAAPKGAVGRCRERVLGICADVIRGLMPYIIVSGVLVVAIAVFFGVSVQAAIILLGLGAVGLGVFVASQSQG